MDSRNLFRVEQDSSYSTKSRSILLGFIFLGLFHTMLKGCFNVVDLYVNGVFDVVSRIIIFLVFIFNLGKCVSGLILLQLDSENILW